MNHGVWRRGNYQKCHFYSEHYMCLTSKYFHIYCNSHAAELCGTAFAQKMLKGKWHSFDSVELTSFIL